MRLSLGFLLVLALVACSSGGKGQASRPDTLTRRQRDSAIGASNLPGARGVQRAIQAQDSARARNTRLDSIARERP